MVVYTPIEYASIQSHPCRHKHYIPSRVSDYGQRRKASARCTASSASPTFSSAASAAGEPQSPNLQGAEKLVRSRTAPGGVGGQGRVPLHARAGRGHPWCLLPVRGSLTPPVLRADTEGQHSSGFARCREPGAEHTASSPRRRDPTRRELWEPLWKAEGGGRGRGELGEQLRAAEEAGRARGAVEGARRGRSCEAR